MRPVGQSMKNQTDAGVCSVDLKSGNRVSRTERLICRVFRIEGGGVDRVPIGLKVEAGCVEMKSGGRVSRTEGLEAVYNWRVVKERVGLRDRGMRVCRTEE